ncbi:hypothetical protein [Aestuariivirga litoralis]|uniref:hypothetical protein n=1 Tax=Aestuariivirga litoralis TaxID=2650924 RepID=UPI0018C4FB67|nr:hypothetical protein [Aestuariivirga litoralis]MBG1231652.1 hypothetical protein [Aestuariivirga litoralis]
MKIKTVILAASMLAMASGLAFAKAPLTIREAMKGTYKIISDGNLVATITISPGGKVTGVQPNGDKDVGRWRISPNDRYCVTFTKWLGHQERCSDITIDGSGIVHGNGFSAHR